MKNLIAISLILVISSCTTPGQVQQESEDRFNSMTTDSVELCTSVTGQGDPLERIVTFSTQSCYTTENGILRMKWNDQFIRGYVSKTSNPLHLSKFIT